MDISGNGRIHDNAASLVGSQPVGSDSVAKGQGKSVATAKDSVELSSQAKILR